MLKTFWGGEVGWPDRQLPNGTPIGTSPDGQKYTTTPGSWLLFPELCEPTAPVVATDVPAQRAHTAGLRMPRGRTTRGRRILAERELNRIAAEHAKQAAAQPVPEPRPPF